MLALLCIYVAISVPFRVGFQIELCPAHFFFWFEMFVDVVFATDILLNFRTGKESRTGLVEMNPKVISKQYLKTW